MKYAIQVGSAGERRFLGSTTRKGVYQRWTFDERETAMAYARDAGFAWGKFTIVAVSA